MAFNDSLLVYAGGNCIVVEDNRPVLEWQSTNEFQLSLKGANIQGAVGMSAVNQRLWEQHQGGGGGVVQGDDKQIENSDE